MVKHESKDMARTSDDRDVRSAEPSRCVELSAFELELIAAGGGGESRVLAQFSGKR